MTDRHDGARPIDPTTLEQQLDAGPGWPDAGGVVGERDGAAGGGEAGERGEAGGPGGLLAGVRVLDLSRVLAGPFATMVLGDLGADVLKVERPGTGDETRRWGPPFHGDDAVYFLAVNRGRRSLTLDLDTPEGAAILRRLALAADVVVENFLPRQLASLGLDRLREVADRTVWVSVRGASEDGPAGDAPGYDTVVQARSGLMGITGSPETGPTKVGVAIADVVTGLYAAVSALAGLVSRGTDGRAPDVEVPLLESAISALVNQGANHLIGGVTPTPMGNEHPNLAPYGPVPCADRLLVVGVGNDRQFRALCDAIGRGELADDPRFAVNADRVANRAALREELAAAFADREAAAWRAELEAAGVPCAPIQSLDEVERDEHVGAVEMIGEVEGPAGPVAQVRSPLRIDGKRPGLDRPPPRLGEHTDEVLRAIGLSEGTIAGLRERGVT